MAVCYPLVKAAHELGHGYAAKAWGREVREMGIMLLVLFPVPYVDASAASALPDKWKRALVGAAGMIAELFLAGIAALLWVVLERSEEHTSELQSLMRISYAVFCLKKKIHKYNTQIQ